MGQKFMPCRLQRAAMLRSLPRAIRSARGPLLFSLVAIDADAVEPEIDDRCNCWTIGRVSQQASTDGAVKSTACLVKVELLVDQQGSRYLRGAVLARRIISSLVL
jgi:hypothetical protein